MRRALLLIAFVLIRCSPAPAPEPAPPPPAETAPSAPAPQATETVSVTASGLNVRRDPSTTADIVAKVKKGDRLTVLLRDAGWVKVTTPAGETGWVAAQHVGTAAATTTARSRSRRGCPADAEFQFTKTPTPSFSDRGAHGLVVVDATVDTKGNVIDTKIISNSTGDEALGFLAEREIKSAKFSPPIRNCVPRSFIFTYKRSF